ncbi:hypothetical protein PAPYR_2706 [Paratrimastix pyriformis]|uniref:ELMO domain-containing protein n=1 Tax=Paratrimastix pyriformis TaxID=342808 RepID=A0ABQ8UNW4_9EUKA|nr:hypothetical protein PAPYR_2706 [Paratrimastix pyriformis]
MTGQDGDPGKAGRTPPPDKMSRCTVIPGNAHRVGLVQGGRVWGRVERAAPRAPGGGGGMSKTGLATDSPHDNINRRGVVAPRGERENRRTVGRGMETAGGDNPARGMGSKRSALFNSTTSSKNTRATNLAPATTGWTPFSPEGGHHRKPIWLYLIGVGTGCEEEPMFSERCLRVRKEKRSLIDAIELKRKEIEEMDLRERSEKDGLDSADSYDSHIAELEEAKAALLALRLVGDEFRVVLQGPLPGIEGGGLVGAGVSLPKGTVDPALQHTHIFAITPLSQFVITPVIHSHAQAHSSALTPLPDFHLRSWQHPLCQSFSGGTGAPGPNTTAPLPALPTPFLPAAEPAFAYDPLGHPPPIAPPTSPNPLPAPFRPHLWLPVQGTVWPQPLPNAPSNSPTALPSGALWSLKGPYGAALKMLNLVNCGRVDGGLTFAHHFCITPAMAHQARARGAFPPPDAGLERVGVVHAPSPRNHLVSEWGWVAWGLMGAWGEGIGGMPMIRGIDEVARFVPEPPRPLLPGAPAKPQQPDESKIEWRGRDIPPTVRPPPQTPSALCPLPLPAGLRSLPWGPAAFADMRMAGDVLSIMGALAQLVSVYDADEFVDVVGAHLKRFNVTRVHQIPRSPDPQIPRSPDPTRWQFGGCALLLTAPTAHHPRAQVNRLKSLRQEMKTPFSPAEPTHQALLHAFWRLVFPARRKAAPRSPTSPSSASTAAPAGASAPGSPECPPASKEAASAPGSPGTAGGPEDEEPEEPIDWTKIGFQVPSLDSARVPGCVRREADCVRVPPSGGMGVGVGVGVAAVQGQDPATDFRGMGILGLRNLVYLARHYPRLARTLTQQSAQREYPFAVAGINISRLLAQLLNLMADEAAARPPSSPDWDSPALRFMCHLHSDMPPPPPLFANEGPWPATEPLPIPAHPSAGGPAGAGADGQQQQQQQQQPGPAGAPGKEDSSEPTPEAPPPPGEVFIQSDGADPASPAPPGLHVAPSAAGSNSTPPAATPAAAAAAAAAPPAPAAAEAGSDAPASAPAPATPPTPGCPEAGPPAAEADADATAGPGLPGGAEDPLMLGQGVPSLPQGFPASSEQFHRVADERAAALDDAAAPSPPAGGASPATPSSSDPGTAADPTTGSPAPASSIGSPSGIPPEASAPPACSPAASLAAPGTNPVSPSLSTEAPHQPLAGPASSPSSIPTPSPGPAASGAGSPAASSPGSAGSEGEAPAQQRPASIRAHPQHRGGGGARARGSHGHSYSMGGAPAGRSPAPGGEVRGGLYICAWEELYCFVFSVLDRIWMRTHATYLDFNPVMQKTREYVERLLALRPLSFEHLIALSRALPP